MIDLVQDHYLLFASVFAGIILLGGIVVPLSFHFKGKSEKVHSEKRAKIFREFVGTIKPPEDFGLFPKVATELASRLNASLDPTFMNHVKKRVMAKNPSWSEVQYEWYLFELKRYFLMTAVMKNVPMYSDNVDRIWHEMILFTKEYNTFCRNFIGETINHSPNVGSNATPDPNERAMFEWVYTSLFELNSADTFELGKFYSARFDRDFLENVHRNRSTLSRYFRTSLASKNQAVNRLVTFLMDRFVAELKSKKGELTKLGSRYMYKKYSEPEAPSNSNGVPHFNIIALSLIDDKEITYQIYQMKARQSSNQNPASNGSGRGLSADALLLYATIEANRYLDEFNENLNDIRNNY
jgi:hypothetical protein